MFQVNPRYRLGVRFKPEVRKNTALYAVQFPIRFKIDVDCMLFCHRFTIHPDCMLLCNTIQFMLTSCQLHACHTHYNSCQLHASLPYILQFVPSACFFAIHVTQAWLETYRNKLKSNSKPVHRTTTSYSVLVCMSSPMSSFLCRSFSLSSLSIPILILSSTGKIRLGLSSFLNANSTIPSRDFNW